jgi:hypothetical protein
MRAQEPVQLTHNSVSVSVDPASKLCVAASPNVELMLMIAMLAS